MKNRIIHIALLMLVTAGLTFAQDTRNPAGATGAASTTTQGTAADAATPVGNPNLIAGYDPGNLVQRRIQVNAQGALVNTVSLADTDAAANNPTADTIGNLGPNGPLRVVLHCFNGTTWDRCRGNTDGFFLGKNTTVSDGLGNTAAFPQANAAGGLLVYNMLFNNTSWDRIRSASLSNYALATTTTARNSIGASLVENGSRFPINSAPAGGVQATASIAAEASVRHAATGICFSAGATAAPAATSMQINLRDGATGAGTVLISFEVSIPASTGILVAPQCVSFTGPIVGTTNTAMTAEWNALLANVKETITLIGFNVN